MNGKKIFAVTRIGAALIAAVILLGCTGWAFLYLLGSPAAITQGAELSDGAYVTADVSFLMDICGAEREEGTGEILAYFVIAPVGDQFAVLRFPAADYDTIAAFEADTQAYLYGTQAALPFHMSVTGMVKQTEEPVAALLSAWFANNVSWMSQSGLIAAVEDELFECNARNLSANGIEAGERNCLRRIVDDEIDAGQGFDGANISAFSADDTSLHFIVGQRDDRHRDFGDLFRSTFCDCHRDVAAGNILTGGFDLLLIGSDANRLLMHQALIELLEQVISRLFAREFGNALQHVDLTVLELLDFLRAGFFDLLGFCQTLVCGMELCLELFFLALKALGLLVEAFFFLLDSAFLPCHIGTAVFDLLVCIAAQLEDLVLCFYECRFFAILCFSCSRAADALRFLLCAADGCLCGSLTLFNAFLDTAFFCFLHLLVHRTLCAGGTDQCADCCAGERGIVLQGGRIGRRRGNDYGIIHCTFLPEGIDDRGDRTSLLAYGHINTVDWLTGEELRPLVDDGINGYGRLSSLTVADDKFPLATSDRNHGINGLEACLQRLADWLPEYDTRSFPFKRH